MIIWGFEACFIYSELQCYLPVFWVVYWLGRVRPGDGWKLFPSRSRFAAKSVISCCWGGRSSVSEIFALGEFSAERAYMVNVVGVLACSLVTPDAASNLGIRS
jgi:hypothetical protein